MLDPTHLSIGEAFAGAYESGGVIGDNGLSVPAIPGRRWVRLLEGAVTPRMFGAIGDGTVSGKIRPTKAHKGGIRPISS